MANVLANQSGVMPYHVTTFTEIVFESINTAFLQPKDFPIRMMSGEMLSLLELSSNQIHYSAYSLEICFENMRCADRAVWRLSGDTLLKKP